MHKATMLPNGRVQPISSHRWLTIRSSIRQERGQ